MKRIYFFLFFVVLSGCQSSQRQITQSSLHYQKYCAQCHGGDRLGITAPALIPDGLERVKRKDLIDTIIHGRRLTQMPAFGNQLNEQEVNELTDYILSPLGASVGWSDEEIKKSRFFDESTREPLKKPVFQADPLNLFFVVELAGPAISILDGDRFSVIQRLTTRSGVHGGIKYSPDGRWAYALSRDGWITKYDVYRLKKSAEVRAGLNSRNIALSQDGRYLVVGNTLPKTLVFFNAKDLSHLKTISVLSEKGVPSRVSAVYTAPPRQSFIVALKDVPEVWEISYSDQARPPYTGLVHDFRAESGEDISTPAQKFPVRRILTDQVLDDFFFDQKYYNILGASRQSDSAQVINLIVGRPTHQVKISGMPHLGSGISFRANQTQYIATPNLKENQITVIDEKTWNVKKQIQTFGPGFFLRSHKNSPTIWADVFFGKDKDAIHVIDKNKLEIIKTLRPAPGKTAAHVEFTDDGRYALVSIWDEDGALVVYDSKTLKEVKRIPMQKPSGKYNIANKIKFEEGTSH